MRRTLPPFPHALYPELAAWARAVEAIAISLPEFSIISTSAGPNSSGLTGATGALAFEIGSATTKLWQKRSASTSTTGWSAFSWI